MPPPTTCAPALVGRAPALLGRGGGQISRQFFFSGQQEKATNSATWIWFRRLLRVGRIGVLGMVIFSAGYGSGVHAGVMDPEKIVAEMEKDCLKKLRALDKVPILLLSLMYELIGL
jgi:hypothetical protein